MGGGAGGVRGSGCCRGDSGVAVYPRRRRCQAEGRGGRLCFIGLLRRGFVRLDDMLGGSLSMGLPTPAKPWLLYMNRRIYVADSMHATKYVYLQSPSQIGTLEGYI